MCQSLYLIASIGVTKTVNVQIGLRYVMRYVLIDKLQSSEGTYCLHILSGMIPKMEPLRSLKNVQLKWTSSGPGSSVSIATGYGVDGPGIESQWGARFSASFQTGPGAHPASCTMGPGSFPGVESGRGVTLTPHPF
jgi:hypothetical protein